MDKNKQYKVALVLYTQGLDYDDRIRKEILSIQSLYPNVSFNIFAVEPRNREEEGLTSYGVPYRIPFLKSREKYSSASHTFIKALDFYNAIRKDLKEFDAIWCADIETFVFVLLIRKKPLLWDLHELPLLFMGSTIKKSLFRLLEKKVRVMIHANKARLDYLVSNNMIHFRDKQYVLRNYPQFNEIDSEYDNDFEKFNEWLGERKCVYLQGIDGPRRADLESLGAVLHFEDLTAVVVGGISPERMAVMQEKFSKTVLKKRVYFTGQIKQLKTPQYIKKCILSLVFYKNTSPNNWLCEPNRLFQSVINGVPVVVGNNPSLDDFVTKYQVGVVADTDGSNEIQIREAIQKAMQNYEYYRHNVLASDNSFLWSSQNGVLKIIIDNLFND